MRTIDLEEIEEKVNRLSLRERALVLMVSTMLIFFGWKYVLIELYYKYNYLIFAETTILENEISSLKKKLDDVNAKVSVDPSIKLNARTKNTQDKNKELAAEISKLTSKLIDPKEMTNVINQILIAQKELEVVKMENIKTTPLIDKDDDEDEATRKHQLQIFKHGFDIELSGKYEHIFQFLKSLESLKWELLFDDLEYEVLEYPKASVKVRVYTLSLDEGWISA